MDVAGDCDDGDSAVFPGASEACDTASDMDCDGVVPWADGDADGWASCLDCDDADATIFPAAAEVCDGVDQDCDDEIDEDAADALAVYVDADGDGYGDPATTDFACAAEAGWSLSAGDCDDGDAAVNPDEIGRAHV